MDRVNMVPGFILKLWKMINDPQCDDLISWSENGQSFIIMDPPKFSQELSKYFKHNNLSSFIRQLNMYGFRKVATIENSGLHPGTDDLHFYHPDFIRDKPELLEAIKRKLPQKIAETVDLRNVVKGISEIEDKQKDVSKTLSEIKRENEMLWAELHDLRQKHQQQQLYISRLMKLVFEAMEQNGIKTNMLQLKRNTPLMIESNQTRLISPEEANVEAVANTVYQEQLPSNTFMGQNNIENNIYNQQDTVESLVPSVEALVSPEDSDINNILYQQQGVSTTSYQIPSLIDQLSDVEARIDSEVANSMMDSEGDLATPEPVCMDYMSYSP